DRDDVVEVVGDPLRQPADALEALGLPQAFFQLQPLLPPRTSVTDVADEPGEDVARRRLGRSDRQLDRELMPVTCQGCELEPLTQDRADAGAPLFRESRDVLLSIALGNDQRDERPA